MKILHIGISNHLGGIETYLYKVASNINLEEYQFDFLTYHDVTPCFFDELSSLGCRFFKVTSRRKNKLRFQKEFDELLKREKYDIVHCHLNSLSFTEPINIALKNNIKVIVHSRNGEMIGSKLSKLLHYLHYLTLPRKHITMLAVSDVAGKWMFGEKADFKVLNNGVDINKFHYRPDGRIKVRQEFGLGDEKVIVHTGAFRRQKNHDFVIDVFAVLHQMEPDTKLLLVGSGKLMGDIKQKVKNLSLDNHVIFAGQRSDVVDVLSAGDIYLFPSFYEGFPNALIEAEACGLYCIVSDTITKQAKIDKFCEYVSLSKQSSYWAKKINTAPQNIDRFSATKYISCAGLDVDSDVKRLIQVYEDILR